MGYLPEYYDEQIGKAKRAIVVAIVLIVLILGLFVAAYLVNMMFFDNEYSDPLEPYTIYPRTFTVWTSNSDIEITLDRQNACDICLLRKADYDNSETTQGKFDISLARAFNTTSFEFQGQLDSGEYVIYCTSVPVSDTVDVRVKVDLLSPILLYVVIVLALLVGLLLLLIGLKVRSIKRLRYEKENEAVRPGSKPAPGWGGEGGRGQPSPQQPMPGWGSGGYPQAQPNYSSQSPVYQQSGYERTPIYSKDDLQFFANVGEGSDGGSSGSEAQESAVYAMSPADGPQFGAALKFEGPDDGKPKKQGYESKKRSKEASDIDLNAYKRGKQQAKGDFDEYGQVKTSSLDEVEEDEGWGFMDEEAVSRKPPTDQPAKASKKGAGAPAGKDAGESKYGMKGDKQKGFKAAPEQAKQAPGRPSQRDARAARQGQAPGSREPRPPPKEDDGGADGYLSPDDL
jgi:hypothetical protein